MEHFDYEGSDLSSDIGFLSNTGPDLLEKTQNYQAGIQC